MTLLNMGPDDQPQVFGRVVPAGSDENAVYMRSLRPGEEDSGEAVHVPAGKRLVIRAGDLSFSSNEIDARSPKGRGGYAPVADTIWTWYRLVGAEDQSLLMLLLAAARRLDATHVFWSGAMDTLDQSRTASGIERRAILFRAFAMAEVTGDLSVSGGGDALSPRAGVLPGAPNTGENRLFPSDVTPLPARLRAYRRSSDGEGQG